MTAKSTDDPSHFADLVAQSQDLTIEQRQQLLEMDAVVDRLRFLSVFLAKQNEILQMKAKIQSDTLRKQLANMIYVGVVAGLLNIPWESL